jgi:hypothetical protein
MEHPALPECWHQEECGMVKRIPKKIRRSASMKKRKKQRNVDRAARFHQRVAGFQQISSTKDSTEPFDAAATTFERDGQKVLTLFVFWATMPLQLTSMWWDACERSRNKR